MYQPRKNYIPRLVQGNETGLAFVVPLRATLLLRLVEVLFFPTQDDVHDIESVVASALVGTVYHDVRDTRHDWPVKRRWPTPSPS